METTLPVAIADNTDNADNAALASQHFETAQNVPAGETVETTEFHILDDASANWFLKKRNNKVAEIARIEAQAAAMIADLQRDVDSLETRFLGEMEEYARHKIAAAGGRRKSYRFFQGTVAFRTLGATPRLDDPGAALNRAAELGHIRVDGDSYLKAAREHLKATGELLPGLVMRPVREKFTIGTEAIVSPSPSSEE